MQARQGKNEVTKKKAYIFIKNENNYTLGQVNSSDFQINTGTAAFWRQFPAKHKSFNSILRSVLCRRVSLGGVMVTCGGKMFRPIVGDQGENTLALSQHFTF